MLVNVSLLLLQFEKCIVNDICDGGARGLGGSLCFYSCVFLLFFSENKSVCVCV